jgi:PhzF family phenazine biosynthesis protein
MQIYQVDAFTNELFRGNPAAVVPLDEWLPGSLMQQIAMENNLAETAFFVPGDKDGEKTNDPKEYWIRWFTPTIEVALCGHATLASAHVLFQHAGFRGKEIIFHSRSSGPLRVISQEDGSLTLDFPADDPQPVDPGSQAHIFDLVMQGLHLRAFNTGTLLFKGKDDYMLVLDSQGQVEELRPDFRLLAAIPSRGLIVTAPGETTQTDFVSRCFFPQSGVDEDPVTGSAHTMMIPYWSGRLGKDSLRAIQLSKRRGWLGCKLAGRRVLISGFARTFMEGEIKCLPGKP